METTMKCWLKFFTSSYIEASVSSQATVTLELNWFICWLYIYIYTIYTNTWFDWKIKGLGMLCELWVIVLSSYRITVILVFCNNCKFLFICFCLLLFFFRLFSNEHWGMNKPENFHLVGENSTLNNVSLSV